MLNFKRMVENIFYLDGRFRKSNGFLIILGIYLLLFLVIIPPTGEVEAGLRMFVMILFLLGLPWLLHRFLENWKSKRQKVI